MSAPKHQHFIPRSYLKNFAIEDKGKFFVEAKHKIDVEVKERLLSIKDICVDKNIYTFPRIEGDDKYSLEKFYANEIDSVYPEVYRLLVNPEVVEITMEQRTQIIATTMSLYFRTPKFLNQGVRQINKVLDFAAENYQDKTGNVKFEFASYNFNFHINDIEDVRANLKTERKIQFLKEHLKQLHDFIIFKMAAGICVYKVSNEVKIITSDNPVAMYSVSKNPFDVFDPTNIIRVPLDPNHFMAIMPNFKEGSVNQIFRYDRDKRFAFTTNLDVEMNSEEWILGYPKSVASFMKDKPLYTANSADNFHYVNDMAERVSDLEELADIMQKAGGFAHQDVADKVKKLMHKSIYKDDADMLRLINALTENGFSVN